MSACATIPPPKPITGSWLDVHHPNPREGDYWNETTGRFSAADWSVKIGEMAALGMDTIVVTSVILRGKTFYPSDYLPPWPGLACADPLGAVLAGAGHYGLRVFLGAGYFSDNTGAARPANAAERRGRREVPLELVRQYGENPSFHGWYLPVEAGINGHFPDDYLSYTREMSDHCRAAAPGKPILIAPYGTRTIIPGTTFRRQLEALPVDFVAYQDEVGVRKTTPEELPCIFDRLHELHRDLPIPLWADMEIFDFEGRTYGSPLVPAPFPRVRRQLHALSPRVEKILCYQYPGLMNPPHGHAFAGHRDSTALYAAYREWWQTAGA